MVLRQLAKSNLDRKIGARSPQRQQGSYQTPKYWYFEARTPRNCVSCPISFLA